MIYSTVDRATLEYIGWQEIEKHCSDAYSCASTYVYDWYRNTDITDTLMLAACALEYGFYRPLSYKEIKDLKEKYFGGDIL